MQQSGWSENDVLAKAQELHSGDKNGYFNLMSEWVAVCYQPRYGIQVGGKTDSGSSGSKRAHESVASARVGTLGKTSHVARGVKPKAKGGNTKARRGKPVYEKNDSY
uniref:Uncharacterized protein n=1 Tax=Brassica oleracea var. oleracea TaxID=109376 RepID=A0A0D3CHC7_BRAOL